MILIAFVVPLEELQSVPFLSALNIGYHVSLLLLVLFVFILVLISYFFVLPSDWCKRPLTGFSAFLWVCSGHTPS